VNASKVQLKLFQDPERIVEQRRIRLGEQDITYTLKRSTKRRSILLTVDERGLAVSAPWRTAEYRITALLEKSSDWVLRKLAVYAARRPRYRIWGNGEQIDFLGRPLRIELSAHEGRPIAQLRDGGILQLSLNQPDLSEHVRELVLGWYRRHAAVHFRTRVAHFCALLDEPLPRIMLSSAQGRWGSCNAKREVRLNWRLMQAPPHVIDYVVAHEVSHLRVMNHSQRFWRVVERLHPDYRAARAELDSQANHYMTL